MLTVHLGGNMSLTILLASADDQVGQRYARFFQQSGFDLSRVESGTECWAGLQRKHPDVLILDESLPWGGGDGVLARLREEADDLPPVILLSHPSSVQSHAFGRGLRRGDVFPVIARFSKSASLSVVLSAVLGGLRDFERKVEVVVDRDPLLEFV